MLTICTIISTIDGADRIDGIIYMQYIYPNAEKGQKDDQ